MSLTQLLNRPITIVRRSASGASDDFGSDVPTETLVAAVGELQQRSRDEPGDQGETSDTLWTLFLPAGTDLQTDDAVIVDGAIFELVGDGWRARNPRTGQESHVECTLRRTAGSEDGS